MSSVPSNSSAREPSHFAGSESPSPTQSSEIVPAAVYGMRVLGLPPGSCLDPPSDPGWPTLYVSQRVGDEVLEKASIGPDQAVLGLTTGGYVRLDRRAGTCRFTVPQTIAPDELVHPYLAAGAGVFSHWLGRESFHAGALIGAHGAWMVAGSKGAGKSTLFAWLASEDHGVLTDDLLIVERGHAFAGPRCIDVRDSAAGALGEKTTLIRSRSGQRLRADLPDCPLQMPLCGFIYLEWADRIELTAVEGRERLQLLLSHRSVYRVPRRPEWLLDLATLPAFYLRRPPSWAGMPEVALHVASLVG